MRRTFPPSLIVATALLVSIVLAQENVSAQEAAPAAATQFTPEQQAEIAAAEANAPLIAAPGAWVSGPQPDYPDAERALGHHGRADVRGLLGVDGRLRYAVIARSTRAPELDARALEAAVASQYRPAQNASGEPVAAMITLPMSFYSFTSSDGVGAAIYTCPQFVADMDWFKATWGEEALHDHYFYLLIRGLGTIVNMNSGRGLAAIESNESYLRRWNRAIETCRNHPQWRFAQAMRPEGDYIDRLAAQQRR